MHDDSPGILQHLPLRIDHGNHTHALLEAVALQDLDVNDDGQWRRDVYAVNGFLTSFADYGLVDLTGWMAYEHPTLTEAGWEALAHLGPFPPIPGKPWERRRGDQVQRERFRGRTWAADWPGPAAYLPGIDRSTSRA